MGSGSMQSKTRVKGRIGGFGVFLWISGGAAVEGPGLKFLSAKHQRECGHFYQITQTWDKGKGDMESQYTPDY